MQPEQGGHMKRFKDGRDWFFEKRFGMFIHWGIYSLTEWQEQVIWRGAMKRKDYEPLVEQFNPVKFDPEAWLDLAQEAGMEFICFTTKHHDGFCMWDTKHTEYNIMNTPYGKDILAMLSRACHTRGMGFGLYYSLPDWHHPNYPNMGRHHEMFGPRSHDDRDEDKYLAYVELQIEELLTNYGKVEQLFWDVNVAKFYKPELNEKVRSLQPGIMINDRGPGPGDYTTPERKVPDGGVFSHPVLAVQSTGRESWGYRDKEDYYSHKVLMQSVDKTLAMGGNYQLNVGPKSDGTICDQDSAGLRRIGKWYHRVKEAFAGCEPCSYMRSEEGFLIAYDDVLLTRKKNIIYVHAYQDLQTTGVMLHPMRALPEKATLLNDGRELRTVVDVTPWRWKSRPALRVYDLPVDEITNEPLIIKLEFGEDVVE